MDMVMDIANTFSSMKQIQLQSAIQTQVLRNAMNSQTQILQELLPSNSVSSDTINPPNLGNNIDMLV